jgi:hypothetical protein
MSIVNLPKSSNPLIDRDEVFAPDAKIRALSRKDPQSLHTLVEPNLFLQNVIEQFHTIYSALTEGGGQNREEEETEEISPTLVPFSQAFSAFDTVEWSELTHDDWALFGSIFSDQVRPPLFFDIVYATLTSDLDQILLAATLHKEALAEEAKYNQQFRHWQKPEGTTLPIEIRRKKLCAQRLRIQATSELDDVVSALIVVLEFMTREDSVVLRVGVPGNTLTDVLCTALLSPDPGPNSNTFVLLSSLMTFADTEQFSAGRWSDIGDWLAGVLAEPDLSKVPETFWYFMLSVGSNPFAGFFHWFTSDFLHPLLLSLLVTGGHRSISVDFFQFLALLWDSDPDSHPIFIANGVQAFLGRMLLSPTGPDLPELSLRLLARCSSESDSCCLFPPQQLIACLGWEEASPDAAFAMAGFAVAGKSPGWEEYLDDTILAELAANLMSGDFAQIEIVLPFLWELMWACYTEHFDPDPCLPFACITFGLWRDAEEGFDLAYRPLCLLVRWFVETGHSEDDVPDLIRGENATPLTPDDDAYFRSFVHELCLDEWRTRGRELHQDLSRNE